VERKSGGMWLAVALVLTMALVGCGSAPEPKTEPAEQSTTQKSDEIDPNIAKAAREWAPKNARLVKAYRKDENSVAFAFDTPESLGDASAAMGEKLEALDVAFGIYDSEDGKGKLLQTEEGEREVIIAIEDRRVAVILADE